MHNKSGISSSKQMPNASIVIATLNNAPVLRKVLDAMLNLDYPAEYEVIVVNDGSTDKTKEMLEKDFSGSGRIRAVNLAKNSGVCRARNAGIKAARYPIIVNMDHDCIPAKGWLTKMAQGFDSEKVGIVSAYDYYGGTSTAFRKGLLEKVGGYGEEYRYYREDTDLSFKIMDLGYKFRLVDADYTHEHAAVKPKGIAQLAGHVLQRLAYHQNDVLLWKKHPTKVCADFLNVKFGFLVDPRADFAAATGLWKTGRREKTKLALSSPRGIVFIENKTPLHALAIVLAGIAYVLAVKLSRLAGSIRFGKLLV